MISKLKREIAELQKISDKTVEQQNSLCTKQRELSRLLPIEVSYRSLLQIFSERHKVKVEYSRCKINVYCSVIINDLELKTSCITRIENNTIPNKTREIVAREMFEWLKSMYSPKDVLNDESSIYQLK